MFQPLQTPNIFLLPRAAGDEHWKIQISIYSFMLKTLFALSLFIQNPEGYQREYQFFPWQFYRNIAPRVLLFIFCSLSILKMVFTTDDIDKSWDEEFISSGWLSISHCQTSTCSYLFKRKLTHWLFQLSFKNEGLFFSYHFIFSSYQSHIETYIRGFSKKEWINSLQHKISNIKINWRKMCCLF